MTHLPAPLVAAQDRLVSLLGREPGERGPLVAEMLSQTPREQTTYWLHLLVAMGIATLGLVVGSAAVIIGAMLVAPLMGPIVRLAMGLATGSPYLVIRSATRVVGSVGIVIGGSALVTLLLPFHELNAELAARTSPTVLDLITAAFCALMGVFAAVYKGSDTATTAAGTSIGISLVPPLCASGWGLGTQSMSVAGGALLLFLTNLVAIVVVGTLSFVAIGFHRVDVVALEHAELAREATTTTFARWVARRLARAFESRWGPVLRFLMPLVLLATIYVPLRAALDEVSWQVRARAAVRASLAHQRARVVDSRLRIERREIELVVVVVGTSAEASELRTSLDAEIRQASGVAPHLEVLAVPDAKAFAGLESTLRKPVAATPAPAPTLSKDAMLEAARAHVVESVHGLWPSASAGEPVWIDVSATTEAPLRLRIVHLGSPISKDTRETLERAAARTMNRPVDVDDVAVPAGALTRASGDLVFVAQAAAAVRATTDVPAVRVCVSRPTEDKRHVLSKAEQELSHALDEILASHPRVETTQQTTWSLRLTTGSCVPPPKAAAPPASAAAPAPPPPARPAAEPPPSAPSGAPHPPAGDAAP